MIFQLFILLYLILHFKQSQQLQKIERILFEEKDFSRDFYRYTCKNRLRIGGFAKFISKVPDKLYRVDG